MSGELNHSTGTSAISHSRVGAREEALRRRTRSGPPLPARKSPAPLPRKELEAALRVADAGHEEEAHDPVEELAQGLPEEGLLLLHERLVHGARADRDGGVRRRELLQLVDGRRKVRVRHEDEAARGLEAAGADREALAAVLRKAQDAEVEAVAAPRVLGARGRRIGGAVVHDDHLAAGRGRERASRQALEGIAPREVGSPAPPR